MNSGESKLRSWATEARYYAHWKPKLQSSASSALALEVLGLMKMMRWKDGLIPNVRNLLIYFHRDLSLAFSGSYPTSREDQLSLELLPWACKMTKSQRSSFAS